MHYIVTVPMDSRILAECRLWTACPWTFRCASRHLLNRVFVGPHLPMLTRLVATFLMAIDQRTSRKMLTALEEAYTSSLLRIGFDVTLRSVRYSDK